MVIVWEMDFLGFLLLHMSKNSKWWKYNHFQIARLNLENQVPSFFFHFWASTFGRQLVHIGLFCFSDSRLLYRYSKNTKISIWSFCHIGSRPLTFWGKNKIYMAFQTKYICGGLFEMKTLFGLERLEYILSVFTYSSNFKALKT